jgi:hypothetical protein
MGQGNAFVNPGFSSAMMGLSRSDGACFSAAFAMSYCHRWRSKFGCEGEATQPGGLRLFQILDMAGGPFAEKGIKMSLLSRICGSPRLLEHRKCLVCNGLRMAWPTDQVVTTPRGQAGERRRRASELYLAWPPVATRNGLPCLPSRCAILTHKFCRRAQNDRLC